LRDFVAVDDVARFVLSKLRQTNRLKSNLFMVVSGKPSTIQEIQKIVEDAIKHKLYVNFLLDPSNEQDISFAPTVIPTGLQPSSLRQNIPMIYADALSSGELFLGNK
jgi:nucleoside-diphosphate-sugar epimerase